MSGNNNHATQSTVASKPILNGNSIVFDGTDDVLTFAHGVVPDSNEASMVFLVANCDSTSGNDGFITNGQFTSGQSFSYRTNGTSQVTDGTVGEMICREFLPHHNSPNA